MHANFADLEAGLRSVSSAGARGILMDLGVSSMQLDQAQRGFSYLHDGPLDMRMDPSHGAGAADRLAGLDEAQLRRILAELGQVRRPRALARGLIAWRDTRGLRSTGDLKQAVEAVTGVRGSFAELSRICQALRIWVNDELSALDAALAAAPDCLASGGRLVIISYHSLEDRRVKQHMRRESQDCLCPPQLPSCVCGHRRRYEILTPRPVRPNAAERQRNPRARSARLRAAKRVES